MGLLAEDSEVSECAVQGILKGLLYETLVANREDIVHVPCFSVNVSFHRPCRDVKTNSQLVMTC